MGLFYRVAYPMPGRKGRPLQTSKMRDAEASMFIADVVKSLGYDYGGPLFNFPGVDPAEAGGRSDDADAREAAELPGPDDILLLSTRPPLDDRETGDRFPIARSYTLHERLLFAADGPLRKWFVRCARSEIILSHDAAAISPEIRERQRMWFRQHGGPYYQSYSAPRGRWIYPGKTDRRTAAFLICAEEAWPGGPKLLAAFGMGGTATLVWAYLLAKRFSDLLLTTPFAMVELEGKYPKHPRRMAFDYDATILGVATAQKAA